MSASSDEPQSERLRPPPAERFAGDVHEVDLKALIARLRAEKHPAKDGHRQYAVYHHRPVGHVLLAFEPDGRLEEHSAHGIVTIQVLEGRIVVEAQGREHDLRAGQMLILNPDVEHSVHAREASAMLLTVHMEAAESRP